MAKTTNPRRSTGSSHLQTGSDSCIMLEMAPGYDEDGLRGKSLATSFPSPFTDETLRHFTTPNCGSEVAEILNMIQTRYQHAYTFSPEREGSRYWISVKLEDAEVESVLSNVSDDAISKFS
ncbi:hypothetical protein PG987_010593 [Apiospora arundinis]